MGLHCRTAPSSEMLLLQVPSESLSQFFSLSMIYLHCLLCWLLLFIFTLLWGFLGNSVQISVHFSHSQKTNSSWKEVSPNSMPAALTAFSSPNSIPCLPFLRAFLCYKLLALEMDLFHLFPLDDFLISSFIELIFIKYIVDIQYICSFIPLALKFPR